jgi:two-component system, NarL family, sensor kinase
LQATATHRLAGLSRWTRSRGARLDALLLAIACVGMAYALTVALLVSRASDQRESIMREAAASARAAAHSVDLELADARSLLFRLAAAKSLGSASLAAFLDEATAAPSPPHSAVLLFDRGGRLLLSTAPAALERDEASAAVRRLVGSPDAPRSGDAADAALVPTASGFGMVVAIPVLGNDGDHYTLALAVGSEGLAETFQHTAPAPGWLAALVDRSGTTVVQTGQGRRFEMGRIDLPPRNGRTEGSDAGMADIPGRGSMFIAQDRSEASGWTAFVGVPKTAIAEPRWRSLILITNGGGVLLVLATVLALSTGGRIARPYVEKITASEARFRAMADTVPAILFAAGPDGCCSYVNRRFYDFTNMPSGAALGFGWMEAVHPKDRERVMKCLVEPANEDGVVLSELRLRDAHGRYRWFLARLRPVRDPYGRIVNWFGSSTDIDHVKQAEGALRAANGRLAAVLAGIDECYCTIDYECRVTFVNEGAARWIGQDPAQIVGLKLGEAMPDLAGEDVALPLRQAIDRQVPFHIERKSAAKSGHWIEVHGYPWADGQSIFFRDITRRKTAEAGLRRAQVQLQATMDALSAHIVVVDERGIITAANAAWRHVGQQDGHAGARHRLGSHYLAACHAGIAPSDLKAMAQGLRTVVEGKKREFRMHYSRQARGRMAWFQLRATSFEESGRHIVIAQEDVTDITRAEAELHELAGRLLRVQDEERRRIARDLHDTTTQNLVAALMHLDFVRQPPRGVEPAAGAVEEVRALIDRSVQELRTLSYLLHPPLLEELGLASALKWFIRGFEKRSGIAVDFISQGDGRRPRPEVESALFRVIQEALTNVHRHSGSLTAEVRLIQNARAIVLEIADRGSGIAGREKPIDTAGSESLGVGISGMRIRLRQLGGTLDISSTASGTRIRARVPIGDKVDRMADRRRAAAEPSRVGPPNDEPAGLGLQA